MANGRVMRPVHPSGALEIAYYRRLEAMLKGERRALVGLASDIFRKMNTASGRVQVQRLLTMDTANRLAFDATDPAVMIAAFQERFQAWATDFDAKAMEMAEWFGSSALEDVSQAFAQNLASACGHTVSLQLTPTIEAGLKGIVADNVALIKSLEGQYADQVMEEVLKSVAAGRDLAGLQNALVERFGVAESRAELIARDQNNKATSAIDRQRKLDAGINKSVWMHSGAGIYQRISHLAADGEEYDTVRGCLIDGEYIHPGMEINCKCVSGGVVPAYADWTPETDMSQFELAT